MSKIIKMTSQNLDELRKDFEEALKGVKLSDGKINFTKTFGNIQRKATLYFTELAYLKMLTLVREFDKEVAWHGIAKRHDTEEDAYIISDILNKRNEKTIKIYDLAKNVLFETADVTVSLIEDGTGMEKFLSTAKEMVQDKKYTPTTPATYGKPYGYGGYYGTYGSQQSTYGGTQKKEETPKTQTQVTNGSVSSGKSKRKKKKQKGGTQGTKSGSWSWQDDYDDYDGYDNPYHGYYR